MIKRKKLNAIVSPFAWCRSNIDYVTSIIEEDFESFLSPSLLEYRPVNGKPTVKNMRYQCASGVFERSVSSGFEFTHHDVLASQDAAQSVERKIARFRSVVLGSAEPVVLMYHHRKASASSVEYVSRKLLALRSAIADKRKDDNVSILLFYQSIAPAPRERRLKVSGDEKLISVTFFTRETWEGNDPNIFWGMVDDDLFEQMLSVVPLFR